MRTIDRIRLATAALALLLAAGVAVAHQVNVFAEPEGDQVSGEVYFSGGGKAHGATVRLVNADGTAVDSATTDAAGSFRFATPAPGTYRVVADLGDGHRGSCPLDLTASTGSTGSAPPAPPSAPTVSAAPVALAAGAQDGSGDLSARITSLSRRIDAYEHRTRLHDILGGLGYIVGVFGVVFFLKARWSDRREGR